MHRHDTMKTIAKAYLTNRKSFFLLEVYHILSEFNLRRLFAGVHILLTLIFKYYLRLKRLNKKNLGNYQMMAQIFSRNQILIVIWKDPGQHCALENTVF